MVDETQIGADILLVFSAKIEKAHVSINHDHKLNMAPKNNFFLSNLIYISSLTKSILKRNMFIHIKNHMFIHIKFTCF